jgi:hypothetical protein
MEKITIQTIPHSEQRYPTVGDWITEEEGSAPGTVEIKVSSLEDDRMEFLIALHELIEWFLAKEHSVPAKAVTAFDEWFEADREPWQAIGILEPGDAPTCPVYNEHRFASAIERLLAHELNVDWREYERAVNTL